MENYATKGKCLYLRLGMSLNGCKQIIEKCLKKGICEDANESLFIYILRCRLIGCKQTSEKSFKAMEALWDRNNIMLTTLSSHGIVKHWKLLC